MDEQGGVEALGSPNDAPTDDRLLVKWLEAQAEHEQIRYRMEISRDSIYADLLQVLLKTKSRSFSSMLPYLATSKKMHASSYAISWSNV